MESEISQKKNYNFALDIASIYSMNTDVGFERQSDIQISRIYHQLDSFRAETCLFKSVKKEQFTGW